MYCNISVNFRLSVALSSNGKVMSGKKNEQQNQQCKNKVGIESTCSAIGVNILGKFTQMPCLEGTCIAVACLRRHNRKTRLRDATKKQKKHKVTASLKTQHL